MGALVSIRAYAKLRAVAVNTLRFHIKAGNIQLHDGKIDVEQADMAWARRRRQSSITPGERTAAARIRRARVRLAMAQDEVAKLDDDYADSAAARAQYQAEAEYVITALKAMPAIEAATVSQELGISPERAERLLDRFVELCLTDIGDLGGRLVGVVDRV